MKKYANNLAIFLTIMAAMSLSKILMELIDDTPSEFNQNKVLVLSLSTVTSLLLSWWLKKHAKTI